MTAAIDGMADAALSTAAAAYGRAVLARARKRACITGGPKVVYAMTTLDAALKSWDRAADSLAVLAVRTATENLLLVIRRECGHDEADYAEEGDE